MANWGGLPSIVSALPNDVRNFLQRVKETLDGAMAGTNRFVTASELVTGGVATVDPFGNIVADTVALDLSPPPTATGFVAVGALTTIMLEWDDPLCANFSHAEIWRASVDNQGLAVLIGTSTGVLYADSVDAQSSYYYWVRFVSKAGIVGTFNAISGVHGTTSADPVNLIDILTANNLYTDTPFYYQATTTIVNGVTIPIGTYIRTAFIANASIGTAQIANLAVDNAKIANVSVSKLTAGSIAIGEYIKSTNYVSGSAGWRIHGDGSAELNNIYARGNIRATSFSAITLQTGEHIKQGSTAYNTGNGFFLGDNGAGVPVFSLKSATNGLTWNGTSLAVQGDITGSSGTFSGSLSGASITGATGAFSGSLSGADITGATGSFGGTLLAGVVDITKLIGTTTNYTAPGTYTLTVPADKTSMRVTLVGGGGGGGGGSDYTRYGAGGGGGSGGVTVATFSNLTPGATYTLTVGAGGTGGSYVDYPYVNPGQNATAGAATSVAGLSAAAGGGAGQNPFNVSGAGYGGVAGNTAGSNGERGIYYESYFNPGRGGAGGGIASRGVGGTGGVSSTNSGAGNGGNGTGYGSGGGGGGNNARPSYGGNGSAGCAIIEFFNPNGVVIRGEWNTLLSALTAQGIATS